MDMVTLAVILFFFGTIIGSFLNVVIYRFNTGKSINGRSMCFSCGKTLQWYELVPLASFLVQHGKCIKCKSVISWQYPIVEALTGVMFVFLALKFLPMLLISQNLFLPVLVTYVYIWCLFLVIAVYDARHTIIPDRLVWFLNTLCFLSLFFFLDFQFVPHLVPYALLLSGPLLALPFWALWFGSRGKWMGLGDAKLVLGIGWLLGIGGGLAALVLAFWGGAIFSIGLLLLKGKRYTMKSEIPFGPFLVLAAFIVFISSIDFNSFISLFTFR